MKFVRLLGQFVVFLLILALVAFFWTEPTPLDPSLESAFRLQAGPFEIKAHRYEWVDRSRATDANAEFEGAPDRRFDVRLWAPDPDASGFDGAHPLVIYSHGFMSEASGGTYLGEHLASYGYVVVSASYPLTHFGAPGGPNANDVINQPADVSFLIDSVLALDPTDRPFPGEIDAERIGVVGTSLGGLTSTLVAYHPDLGDPRIAAVISIAGPSVLFTPAYFDLSQAPFMMIAGTHDSMINYEENAAPIPDMIARGGLLTIEGASHAGFSHISAGPFRVFGNPDSIGCRALTANLDIEKGENPFPDLGGPEQHMIDASDASLPCEITFGDAIPAGRQQWFATLATHAFFESHFARDEAVRAAHAEFLAQTLPRENSEVRFEPARRRF